MKINVSEEWYRVKILQINVMVVFFIFMNFSKIILYIILTL